MLNPHISYFDKIKALSQDAEQMEQVYQEAVQAGETAVFQQAINDSYTTTPDNLLYAAWFYRLKQHAQKAKGFVIAWAWVIPLALLNGALFWLLADEDRFMITIQGFRNESNFLPALFLLAAPLTALFLLVYLTAVSHKKWQTSLPTILALFGAAAYVLFTYRQTGTRPFQEQYLTLMAAHLPLLALAGVGLFIMGQQRDAVNRVSFLIKSLEVLGLSGALYAVLMIFFGITTGLFAALDIQFPDALLRLFLAGGGGLIVVVATAVLYNPQQTPANQAFDHAVYKLVYYVTRALLPLTLIMLLIYLAFIPFNFWQPFENRDVLVTYNILLFAVVALLLSATFEMPNMPSPQTVRWVRWAVNAIAILTFIISLYALAAILYRTSNDRLTPNRLAFIGWNIINSGLLLLIIFWPLRAKSWLAGVYGAYGVGTAVYAIWALIILLATPWLFAIDQGQIETLPTAVQRIIYEQPDPILLKCSNSPHIYLLDSGQKRWVKDIGTFNERGYVWKDVAFISCDDLRLLPDGIPIPTDAGPPPQP